MFYLVIGSLWLTSSVLRYQFKSPDVLSIINLVLCTFAIFDSVVMVSGQQHLI